MAIPSSSTLASHKKKSRRRRPDKPAITARLILDDSIKGDAGLLSDDLFSDLFPNATSDSIDGPAREVHIAVAPWAPNANSTDTAWSIVPVRRSSHLKHSTVHFSPTSPALQSFAVILQQVAPSKLSSRSGIEVLVLDVAPLPLETVFVSLENDAAARFENGEALSPRDSNTGSRTTTAANSQTPEERLTTALRAALRGFKIVHTGDLFPLPLAPDPLTHAPPNPGKILLCEPVAQGVLTDSTKIILVKGKTQRKQAGRIEFVKPIILINGIAEDGQGNTEFYTAPEERSLAENGGDAASAETETDGSGSENDDNLSDDSMDDMISLEAPMLQTTNATGAATPMTVGTLRGRKTNGVATPGSVFSNFTATTARPDRPRGRLFRVQGLKKELPSDLLHPKPFPEEDEEARIYVDVASLSKIGCFSGDWARIEAAEEPPTNGFGAFGLGSFDQEPETSNWRPARVYSLPEGYVPRPVTRSRTTRVGERRMSFFEAQAERAVTPAAYASPIFIANLDGTSYLRIAPLKRAAQQGKGGSFKIPSASHPPYARDIAIHHVRTPISAERAYQTAVLGGLKRYFAQKLRLVRPGDLIAVPVDAQLGKALQEAPGVAGSEVDDVVALTARANDDGAGQVSHVDSVAWFKVGQIQIQKTDEDEEGTAESLWGSVACIDSSTVAMHGSGSETSRIPGTRQSTWPYYLGLKKAPRRGSDAAPPPLGERERDQEHLPPLRRQIGELLAAATSVRAIHLKMPPVAILLTSSHRNIGKATLATNACGDIGLHTYAIDAYDILSEGGGSGSDVKTEGFLRTRADRAISCGSACCALLIQHIEALTAERIETTIKEILEDVRVLIATTNEVDKVPDGVRALFTHELEMGAPDEKEREAILRTVIGGRGVSLEPAINLNGIALKTAALVAGDLVDVVERASIAQQGRLEKLSGKATSVDGLAATVRDVQVAGGPTARCLTASDFEVAVEAARKNFSDSIGAPKIPNVTWDDVGGLSNVKDAITETIQLPLERPELFAKGMKKRSGILFYGPPGTGKTLLAKAIATEYSLNFFSVKGPELLNMYIGESEANVRRVFQRARDARPCCVFFDELDSVAPKRGNQGDSGGVMDRIVSQLLAELDGMSGGDDSGGVFVIGATNRPDLLDPALLRPGRFDKMLYLGVSDTHDKQRTILEALTRKFTLDPSVSLANVAQQLPFTYTGADFYALCSDAMLKAVTRQAAAVDAKVKALNADPSNKHEVSTAYFFDHFATPADIAVMVREEDFLSAHEELIPSVSAGELAHYEQVRALFEGGSDKKKASNGGSQQGPGSSLLKGKGKGKAKATDQDEYETGSGVEGLVNGSGGSSGKGKGKAVARFQDGTASDDDGLY